MITEKEIIEKLKEKSDETLSAFNEKLTLSTSKSIGVRTKDVIDLSKKLTKQNGDMPLDNVLTGEYIEVDYVVGFSIVFSKATNKFERLYDFSQKINNWAVCDIVTTKFKLTNNEKEKAKDIIDRFIRSNKPFVVRVGLLLLTCNFLTEKNIDFTFKKVEESNLKGEYYVDMMIAWLIQRAYTKNREKTLTFLKENKSLTYEIRLKAIQKLIDSRVTQLKDKEDLKEYRKELRNKYQASY